MYENASLVYTIWYTNIAPKISKLFGKAKPLLQSTSLFLWLRLWLWLFLLLLFDIKDLYHFQYYCEKRRDKVTRKELWKNCEKISAKPSWQKIVVEKSDGPV